MSVLHCLMMSHGGELMARYCGLLQFHHEYASELQRQVVGLNDKLSFFDAAFVKSKVKGKESKKKIKSLTKSLSNLHAEVARLSANLNRATVLEADKDEEILRLKATPSEVQGELLSLATSAGFERGLSMHRTKEEFAAVLEKISQSVPGRREWANVMVDGPDHEMTNRAVDANLWNVFVQGASHAVDDDFKLTLIGSERVSSGPSDVVVALFVGGDIVVRRSHLLEERSSLWLLPRQFAKVFMFHFAFPHIVHVREACSLFLLLSGGSEPSGAYYASCLHRCYLNHRNLISSYVNENCMFKHKISGPSKKLILHYFNPAWICECLDYLLRRVASELDVIPGYDVGYKLRFENCAYRDIRIKFVSNGTLLRELACDPKLKHYSAIIIDEAHERTIEIDILMGFVKNLVLGPRANNLKVFIASATLDGNKFSKYFFDCTVINVPGRLLPVETTNTNEQPDKIHLAEPEGDILIFLPGEDEIHELIQLLDENIKMLAQEFEMDAQLLPLYDSLSPNLLERVFAPSPANCRRFIVSTNIAETSITVPGIRGQAIQWAGRAGRLRSGRCIRLYTLDIYLGTLPDDVVPEIQRSPIASSVLLLKSLQLDVKKFGFLDVPSSDSIDDALKVLFLIDAIDENGTLTTIGKRMAELSLEPSLARFLLEAVESGCVYQAASVAGMLLAEGSLFHQQRFIFPSRWYWLWGSYPVITDLMIYTDWAKERNRWVWCKHHNLQAPVMRHARHVRDLLVKDIKKYAKGKSLQTERKLADYNGIRKCLCCGYANQLAERKLNCNSYIPIGKSDLFNVHSSSKLRPDFGRLLPKDAYADCWVMVVGIA
nr:hypothetical protein [Tanacetum cinerariifolium]